MDGEDPRPPNPGSGDAPADATQAELTLVNRKGLHARAAARFVQTAGAYDATVTVHKDGQSVDGRSIMGLLMLGAPCGSSFTIEATGPQAREAVSALSALVADGFGEAD